MNCRAQRYKVYCNFAYKLTIVAKMRFFPNIKLKLWLLIALFVLFLSLPFLVKGLGFWALIGFVPLFLIDEIIESHGVKRAWIYYCSAFLLWNLVTTYWIYNATVAGAIGAIIVNALQMSLIFALFRLFRKRLKKWGKGNNLSLLPYIFFIVMWLAWEHFYFNAEISWPWLVLGNAFARSYKLIQWYEYTGVLGGSLWVLVTSLLIFKTILSINRNNRSSVKLVSLYLCSFILVALPMLISRHIFKSYKEEENPREFVVLQPNIDPYFDKFQNMPRARQDSILIALAEEKVTDNTNFVVAPETFTSHIDLDDFDSFSTIKRIRKFIGLNSNTNFICGAITLKFYPWGKYPGSSKNEKPTLTARKGPGYWYDAFNSSFLLDSTSRHQVFHKSKLVVLAEFVPFPKLLSKIEKLTIKLGGTTSSYGTQPEISIFTANDSTKIGTAICYESVYGDYYRGYINKGAQVMTVITNDGWWGNTPGYRQHLSYSSLRAIETRRSIARSANTGISALINQRGDILQSTGWWKKETLRGNLNLNDELTFYVKYGDIIGKTAIILFLLLTLFYCSLLLFTVSSRLNFSKTSKNILKHGKNRDRR